MVESIKGFLKTSELTSDLLEKSDDKRAIFTKLQTNVQDAKKLAEKFVSSIKNIKELGNNL